jgi:hypothetical protein
MIWACASAKKTPLQPFGFGIRALLMAGKRTE